MARESRAQRAGRLAGQIWLALAHHHLNVAAMVGIVSMTVAAAMLYGEAIAFAVFGGFTWLTTLIAAEISVRARGKD